MIVCGLKTGRSFGSLGEITLVLTYLFDTSA